MFKIPDDPRVTWVGQLLRKLGLRIPMQPGKGYTFLIKPKVTPMHGILFADIHAGATPLGDRVRIGGTMEFSGYDLKIDERRIIQDPLDGQLDDARTLAILQQLVRPVGGQYDQRQYRRGKWRRNSRVKWL